ncbi:unnamed protein product [Taenia asiatica]|uniref:purine-nucleoside phosphorylase n=1 Tax=Taenia asiatica TaxID=60517 RepID=A0A3P6PQS1_TAEAS|nr:unnamed protein product [Taenia asiatica]
MVFGILGGKNVMVVQGRFHAFERCTQQQITLPGGAMRLMGCEYLFMTNATGGLHQNYDIIGTFLNIYIKGLRNQTPQIAQEMGIRQLMHDSMYMCCYGPTYGTPAEARALRLLDADVLGMSTTAETTAAHHAEMHVLALSLVTNHNILDIDRTEKTNHVEFLETGLCRGDMIATMLTHILAVL